MIALETLIANERPLWLVGLCRIPLGILYQVRLPPRAADGAGVDYRASAARDRSPWRNFSTLTIAGARIDAIPGTDAFAVSPTGWRRAHLTRIEIVRQGDDLDFRARYVPSSLAFLAIGLVVMPAYFALGEPQPEGLVVWAIAAIGASAGFLRARSDAMEHGRLAMERLGDAIRASDRETGSDVGPSRWPGRLSCLATLLGIPVLVFVLGQSEEPRGREAGSTGALPPQWYIDAAVRRELDLAQRGLAYGPTIHSGLARLDDGMLLAQRSTEVAMARRSIATCAVLADGVIDEQVLLPQLAISGADALRSWDVQIRTAMANELGGTGALLPADPDAVVAEGFERSLATLGPEEAEEILSRLTLDRDASPRARCDTYLARETLLSHLALEERAAVLRAMHVIAAREARASSP